MTRALILTRWIGSGASNDHFRPLVADQYPLTSWADVTGQAVELIPYGMLPYSVEVTAEESVLDQVEADTGYALLWRSEPPVTLEAAVLRAELEGVVHFDVAKYCTSVTTWQAALTRITEAQHRPPWRPGQMVAVGGVFAYQGNLYEVVQSHTTQADWTPDATPALWKRFWEPSEGPPPWQQPTGAHDAYQTGDRVTYEGRAYESRIDGNVWSPEAYPAGWQLVN